MHRMMRSLKASSRSKERLAGRGSPQVASQPVQSLVVFPFGSTDGTGVKLPSGSISGIEAQTQAQQISDYTGTLQYLAPKCYGIRGSYVVSNFAKYSNDFTNAVWDHGTDCTVASTTVLAPDGTNTASFIRESAGAFVVWPRSDQSIPQTLFTANMPVTMLANVQAAGRSWAYCLIAFNNVNAYLEFWVNLDTGELGSVGGNLATREFHITRDPDNGWVEIACSVMGPVSISPAQNAVMSVCGTIADGAKGGWTGDGVSGINQWECGFYPNAYGYAPKIIHTTADPVTVCYDHLPDGTPLRPFYTLGGGIRYNVFRPTELARSRTFNVGDCIEAVASDGIRRYYRAILAAGVQNIANEADRIFSANTGNWVPEDVSVTLPLDNTCTFTNTPDQYSLYSTAFSILPNTTYDVAIGIKGLVAGGLKVRLGGYGTGVESAVYSANGSYHFQLTTPATGINQIAIMAAGISTLKFTGVMVQPANVGTSGITAGTAPTFIDVGSVVDNGVIWEMAGYASIMGIEFAPTGNANHPEGVLLHFPASGNVLGNDQIVAMDVFLDTAGIWSIYGQTSVAFQFNTNLIYWFVGAQTRASTADKTSGVFLRLLGRMSTANAILYIDGAMFTGASGGNLPPTGNVFFGTDVAGTMPSMTILNFRVLTNSALNDANAIARSRYDLKPYVALNADNNAELANV